MKTQDLQLILGEYLRLFRHLNQIQQQHALDADNLKKYYRESKLQRQTLGIAKRRFRFYQLCAKSTVQKRRKLIAK